MVWGKNGKGCSKSKSKITGQQELNILYVILLKQKPTYDN